VRIGLGVVVLFALGLGVFLSAVVRRERDNVDTVAYHLDRYHYLQKTEMTATGMRKAFFDFDYLTWQLEGKPSVWDKQEELFRRRDALIRLGFFEEERFHLEGEEVEEFIKRFDTAAKADGIPLYPYTGFVGAPPDFVSISSTKENMVKIRETLKKMEAAKEKP
jgi:hypothetical protein